MTDRTCEVSWFSALCDDDYEFLGVPELALFCNGTIALLAALRDLLDDSRRTQIQETWAREREEYHPENVAARTLEIYRQVLAGR